MYHNSKENLCQPTARSEKLNLIINDQPTKTTAIIFFKVKGNVGLYKSAYTNEH